MEAGVWNPRRSACASLEEPYLAFIKKFAALQQKNGENRIRFSDFAKLRQFRHNAVVNCALTVIRATRQHAAFTQNYAVPVSEFVRKSIRNPRRRQCCLPNVSTAVDQ